MWHNVLFTETTVTLEHYEWVSKSNSPNIHSRSMPGKWFQGTLKESWTDSFLKRNDQRSCCALYQETFWLESPFLPRPCCCSIRGDQPGKNSTRITGFKSHWAHLALHERLFLQRSQARRKEGTHSSHRSVCGTRDSVKLRIIVTELWQGWVTKFYNLLRKKGTQSGK